MKNTRNIALLIIITVVLILVGTLLKFIGTDSTYMLKINAKKIKSVSIYDKTEVVGDGNNKFMTTAKNNSNIRLAGDHTYLLVYKAANGYSDGSKEITLNKDLVISIEPDFSKQRLSNMLNQEITPIRFAFTTRYPSVPQYELQTGWLYKSGDWYASTLKYIGDDNFNDDTLRVVMHKENNSWIVKTIPDITLSRLTYPKIPVDILRDINAH